jgi:putative nucleotidyltransferase with HDIG domain
LRDRALGRATIDLDVLVEDEPRAAAAKIARAGGRAACFELSAEFGAWRVVARDRSWQVDVAPMRGETLCEDLALRDFTINAVAEPLVGGEPVDPFGGLGDVRRRTLRAVSEAAFRDDPLRVLRVVRFGVELGMEVDSPTTALACAQASALAGVSGERVFAELRRIFAAEQAVDGLRRLARLGADSVVLPELAATRGVEQNRYHHRDVYEHTLEVFERVVELTSAARGALEEGGAESEVIRAVVPSGPCVEKLLAEPLADEMTRGQALRWGALLHDAAKPLTRGHEGERITFLGHDARGADLARDLLGRMGASERLRVHVAALVRHHLKAGFLVHEPQPLSRETVFGYLNDCGPVPADVTLLSIADRLATRGDRAEPAIEAHLAVTRGLLADALRWRESGPPLPLIRGDELAAEVGIEPGPALGLLLRRVAQAQYAGAVATRDEVLVLAHELIATSELE